LLAPDRPQDRLGEEVDDLVVEEGRDDRHQDDGHQRLREPVAELTEVFREGHPPFGILLLLAGRLEQPTFPSRAAGRYSPALRQRLVVSVGSVTGRELVTSPGAAWMVRCAGGCSPG